MAAQSTYKFNTALASAGAIADLAPYAIDTYLNEESDGTLKFGMGVKGGTDASKQVKLPTAKTEHPLGVVVNDRTTELDLAGNLSLKNKASVGVMRYGRVWVRVVEGVTVAVGDATYISFASGHKGEFTNTAGSVGSETAVAISGKFLTTVSNGIAEVELYNSAN